jgi:RHS repeat-associated protein
LLPGQGCVEQEGGPPFTFSNCTWQISGDAALNVMINPMNNPPNVAPVVSFAAPPNMTQLSATYSFTATCAASEIAYTVTVPPLPERPCSPCKGTAAGKPIDVADGEDQYSYTDVAFSGPFGLSFKRRYASQTVGTSDLGANWQHNYDAHLDVSQLSNGQVAYYDQNGLPVYFSGVAPGSSSYDNISGSTLALNAAETSYTLTSFSNEQWTFNSGGALTGLRDRIGNAQTVTRDATSGHNDRIASVSDPLGRQMCFYYDSLNRITGISWLPSGTCPGAIPTSGTVVTMVYDSGTNCATGQLCSVTEPDRQTWTYQYQNDGSPFTNNLTMVRDPLGDPEEINTYSGYQVVQQVSGACSGAPPCADTGSDLSFSYPSADTSSTVTITDGEARTTAITYDPNALLLTTITGPLCNCGGDQTRAFTYDANDRIKIASDDGVDGSTPHTLMYSYDRDNGTIAYPGPTQVVENLDTSGTTRTTSYLYYPIGDSRQDLPKVTTWPSVEQPGSTMSKTETYPTNGTLTQRSVTGYVDGSPTTYTWKWSYDGRGRMLTAIGPRTDVTQQTTFKYFSDTDSDHVRAGQLSTATDALGHVTTFSAKSGYTSYDPFGNAQSMTDPNGVVTEHTYDPRGRLLTNSLLGVPGDTATLTAKFAYDGAGRTTSFTKPLGNGATFSYDTSDRESAAVRVDKKGLQHERMAMAFNANDQITSRSAQACTSPAASCAAWSTTWGIGYNFATTSDLSSVTHLDGTSRAFTYIASGPVETLNDEDHPTGSDFTYSYDVAGRRLKEARVLGSSSIATSYSYDVHDNLTSIDDPNGNVTTYVHDDFNRLEKEVSRVQGTTAYRYDPDSDLISVTDANGSTRMYAYDALDRPLSETATNASSTLTTRWTYDDATSGHFGIGRLATMTDPSGSSAFTYERRGHVAVVNRQIVGNAFTQAYTYDGNANVATMTYPDGYIVTTGYDFADRPDSSSNTSTLTPSELSALAASGLAAPSNTATPEVRRRVVGARSGPSRRRASGAVSRVAPGDKAALPFAGVRNRAVSASSFVASATYLAYGPISKIVYGNGTTQNFTWTDRYFPMENKLTGGSTLANYVYKEDPVGNITGIADKINAAYNRTYGYDDLNRVVKANLGTATGSGYTYDPMGNMKTLTLAGDRTDAFTYKPGGSGSKGLPELSSVTENGTARTIAYDAFGNVMDDGLSAFSYSPRELLGNDSRFIAAYYYDGFGQRVSTTLSADGTSQDSFFDQWKHLVAETGFTSGTPAIDNKYIWLGDRPVAQVNASGTSWTFADHLGTPLIQTGSNATVTWQGEYEAYGNIFTIRTGSTLHQPLRFPGQSVEQFATGSNGPIERSYNNARWYQPTWGRYDEPDPLGVRKPSMLTDLYTYAEDAPTELTDPSGKDSAAASNALQQFAPPPGYNFPPAAPDPYLLQPAYGNYCGQFRTNGTDIDQSDLSPSQIGTVPVINGTDGCCLTHDQCRSSCDFKNGTCRPHSETQPQCHCRCDRAIVACVNSQKPQDIGQMTVGWGIVGAIRTLERLTNECSGVGLK